MAARGFHAGPIITAPDGYPATFYGFFWHYEVATPEEAQAAVEDPLDQDVDVIKIALEPGHPQDPWPVLSLEQVRAIVEAAHTHDTLVRAHIRQAAMLDVALNAGVDVIEHVPLPFCLGAELKQWLEEDSLHLADLPEFEAQLARMAEQGTVLVPTLDATTSIICDLPGLGPEEQQAATEFLLEIVHHFQELGGVVALGNDFGCPGVAEGMPIREMELLLAAGLTPMELIEGFTRHAAYACGHSDELGTLEPGKLADLIVLDGSPLHNIEAVNRVALVIRGGEIGYIPE